MKKSLLSEEKNKILDFAVGCEHIYIYGAGNFGKCYLDLLQQYGYDADGFIVTKKHALECLGKPIYTIEEIVENISAKDGVIPAFTNSDVQEIVHKFTKEKPQILDFDHKIMLSLENEIHFFPLLDELDKEYPQLEKKIDLSEWKSILLVRLEAIGDAIFTTPFIRELRKSFPESRISVVLRKQNQKILADCPYIDQLFLYDSELLDGEVAEQSQNYREHSKKIRRFTDKIFHEREFDVVFLSRELLCGRNTMDELLIAYYSKARYRIGRMLINGLDKQHLLKRLQDSFTFIANPSEPMHEAAYALDLLKQCGCKIDDERMELWVSPQCERRSAQILEAYHVEKYQILIALGIVASVATRTWKIENYNQIIRHYGENLGDKIGFVIMGGKDAEDTAKQLDHSYGNIINLAGKTDLDETAVCMRRCHLYVGSNTGLLHFASAFGVPSVTIYSELSDGKPTDGDSPLRMGAWKVPHIDLVPPAGLDGCHGACRMKFSHCINQITPKQVIDSINQLMNICDKGNHKGD